MPFSTPALGGCLLTAVVLAHTIGPLASPADLAVRAITWADVRPLHPQLAAHGVTARSFASRITAIRGSNAQRVREGDLDHLIFYLLQSTGFTTLPSIEPALSAKMFVQAGHVPDAVRDRAAALLRALRQTSEDPRRAYFRQLIDSTFPDRTARQAALLREYTRVMRFVYEKEFVAQRSDRPADGVADLYRTRGLSTDTAVEAGYLVYQGLGVVKAISPERAIRRVLIVGPGLDLAPRTGLLEGGPPESYQPWAVIDALFALGLSTPGTLEVFAADINPRVVDHLRGAVLAPPVLTLASGIEESATVTFSQGYREYFAGLGARIGTVERGDEQRGGSLWKRVRVRSDAAGALRPVKLDIVTERIHGRPDEFDLVIATNILPYFGELELMLAMSNVAAMLAPEGVFLHNEPRPSLGEITTAVGLPFQQLRQATLATVQNAPPLVDTVFVHTRSGQEPSENSR